jgi:hypothetical protein
VAPGKEVIFSFTPILTGTVKLVFDTPGGGLNYYYKEASSGCNADGWTCIAGNLNGGFVIFGPLTAGVEYLILADALTTGHTIRSIHLECPALPSGCLPAPNFPQDFETVCPGPDITLRWQSAPDAVAYQVYFGQQSPPPFLQFVNHLSISVPTSGFNQTFYWQIRPIFENSIAEGCPVWQFTRGDIEPPVITCPQNITITSEPDLCGAVIVFPEATATDNCSFLFVEQLQGPQNGSFLPVGTYPVTYIAFDNTHQSTCTFTVTIADQQAPTITCLPDLTVTCLSEVPPVALPMAEDNCSGVTVNLFQTTTIDNGCANKRTIIRQFHATDASGNTTSCEQTIEVIDNTLPVITPINPLITNVPTGGTIEVQCFGSDPNWDPPVFNEGDVSVTKHCTGGTITTVFNSTLVDEGNCPVDGYINRYRDTWIATDDCGNSSSYIVFVNLTDNIPPILHGIPQNITVNCDEIPAPPLASAITATDECLCACTITFSSTDPAPGCQDGQVIQRKWIATDACGNTTAGIQLITLRDKKGPVMSLDHPSLPGVSDGSLLEYTCNEGGIPSFFDQLDENSITSDFICSTGGDVTFKETNHEPNNCEFFGYVQQRTFTWTSTDPCGNTSTFTLFARVIDDEAPVLINVPALVVKVILPWPW